MTFPLILDINMSQNVLWKTRTYLVGAMEYADGTSWRDTISKPLTDMGVLVFNPYHKPFIKDVDESGGVKQRMYDALRNKNYDYVEEQFRKIRIYDLNLVDRSDFIIAYIQSTVPTFGSMEELVTAVRMKKPTFIISEGGKDKCPLWIFGMFPHKYIYNNLEEVVDMIKKIDSGEKTIDSDRWRLLRKELR